MVVPSVSTVFSITTQPNYRKTVTVFIPVGLSVSGTGASTFTVTYPSIGLNLLKNGSSFTPTTLTYSTNAGDLTTSYTTSSTGAYAFTRLFNLYLFVFTPTYENATNTYTITFSYTPPLPTRVADIKYCYSGYGSVITLGTFSAFATNFAAYYLDTPYRYLSSAAYIETPYGLATSATGITEMRDIVYNNSFTYNNPSYIINDTWTTYASAVQTAGQITVLSFPLTEYNILVGNITNTAGSLWAVVLPDISGIKFPLNVMFRFRIRFGIGGSSFIQMHSATNYVGGVVKSTSVAGGAYSFQNISAITSTGLNNGSASTFINIENASGLMQGIQWGNSNGFTIGLRPVNGIWYVYI